MNPLKKSILRAGLLLTLAFLFFLGFVVEVSASEGGLPSHLLQNFIFIIFMFLLGFVFVFTLVKLAQSFSEKEEWVWTMAPLLIFVWIAWVGSDFHWNFGNDFLSSDSSPSAGMKVFNVRLTKENSIE